MENCNSCRILFFNMVVTISLMRIPMLIVVFLAIVFLEYIILNHYWHDQKKSLTISFLGNLYSSAIAIPLLYFPLPFLPLSDSIFICPATISNLIIRTLLFGNESMQTPVIYLIFFSTGIIILIVLFIILMVITAVIEVYMGRLIRVPTSEAIIYANLSSYTLIVILLVITGIFTGFLNREVTDVIGFLFISSESLPAYGGFLPAAVLLLSSVLILPIIFYYRRRAA